MPTSNANVLMQFFAGMDLLHRTTKIAVMVGVDFIALPFCLLNAMLLRAGDLKLAMHYGMATYGLIALVTIAAFSMSDSYRAVIRFIDQRLLSATGLALGIAVLCADAGLFAINDEKFPHSALAICWFIVFSYIVTLRICIRNLLRDHGARRRLHSESVAIYGAGEAGARLAQTMRNNEEYRPMCIFNDNHLLNERSIAGLRVFNTDREEKTVRALGIRSIFFAIPPVSPQRLRDIVSCLAHPAVTIKILSRLIDLMDGKVASGDSIRDLKFEDLRGRAPVPPHMELCASSVRGKTVLVTVPGGSIGGGLCRQVVPLGRPRLILLDHSKYALYTIRQELATRFPKIEADAHRGSVCNSDLVDRLMQQSTDKAIVMEYSPANPTAAVSLAELIKLPKLP